MCYYTNSIVKFTFMSLHLSIPLAQLPRVTPHHAGRLAKMGLTTVRDLLYHFPFRYEDFATIYPIAELTTDTNATVVGTVTDIAVKRLRGRKLSITTATLTDDTGSVSAIWFNQSFIATSTRIGQTYRISGKVAWTEQNGMHFSAPAIERAQRDPTSTGRLVPIYPETAGITSKWLRWQIHMILAQGDLAIPDPLPDDMRTRLHLPTRAHALKLMHYPRTETDYHLAHKRFMFEEMLLLQLLILRLRSRIADQHAPVIARDDALIKKFLATLPFTPTDAQRKSAFAILTDMAKPVPMHRLLNGDVGAGKTLVALIAALAVASSGKQVAILAPTEVLAQQHFTTFLQLLAPFDIAVALVTSAYKIHGTHPALTHTTTRDVLHAKIRDGAIRIAIGTHALLQEDVVFRDLALIVVDEQHRFGVAQRAALTQKNLTAPDATPDTIPHLLTMTATPIPRTFALALFGDLHVSVLDEKPGNRKDIITRIIPPSAQAEAYTHLAREIDAGRQAYVILPLVEESDALKNVKAAKQEYERLATEVFPTYTLGLMHGRLKPKEKEKLMNDFAANRIHILVSTSVVEVGVDVPNATIMIIENAERFGLSQLHQFRGRIGRGQHQSYCFLFSLHLRSPRLHALVKHTDGFALAEIDLQLRGPGEFLGTRQSGIPDGAMKNITNTKLITLTRDEAKAVLTDDPHLTAHPVLRDAVAELAARTHYA